MTRQLVLKEIIPNKKRKFKDELFEILFSLNLPEYLNKYGNKQLLVLFINLHIIKKD